MTGFLATRPMSKLATREFKFSSLSLLLRSLFESCPKSGFVASRPILKVHECQIQSICPYLIIAHVC